MHSLPALTHRALVAVATALLLAGFLPAALTAHAAPLPPMSGESRPTSSAPTVDGFRLTHLPAGLGSQVSEFAYTWEDVDFRNLVWESQTDEGYRVDLNAHVLRGDVLTNTDAVRQYLSTYLERTPSEWPLEQATVNDHDALLGDEDVFWQVSPGVAIWISTDASRFTRQDLLSTARGIEQVD